ncbi:hypothetical protein NKW54_08665 [Acetobacter cerevisiae]|uniref:DUF551 domain-containing protein n=1 Tax=Acetobacter cerevisiae TaxID=178900 RepID=A0A149UU84_9PROT|nr:hypothetical protein [Acetobacter cerevisiae]KXV71394.1 hypothetical protein AD952_09210 [Acetobacter cerevisiae]MCP1246011.1 hypothetical protein [Acetobacter cerevisiae]MCP1255729.1 hypothetical protein [Acetobacter cerevisiae]
MTDPRIEALITAAQAEGLSFKHAISGDDDQTIAARILAAADAAAWRPLVKFPPPSNAVLIKSEQGGEKHYAVAKWDLKIDAWRNEDQMYSPRYFTQWQPLGGEIGA